MNYRGRFAPTPSGPLHFGSLFAAVVSFLDARANNGQWLLRIDDLDPPREQPGASELILKTLNVHGLHWDETETYQSENHARYLSHLDTLHQQNRLFWCTCSRKMLQGQTVYPGTCRNHRAARPDSAIRFEVVSETDHFTDLFQGHQQANLKQELGDVVLRRRDQLFAYQLAVVADDMAAGITHIIRGIDLLPATFWQREIYRAVSGTIPVYGHFPVLHATGSEQKLSKQNLAPAVDDQSPEQNLLHIFQLLDLDVDPAQPEEMLKQATTLFQRSEILCKQILHTPVFQLD